MSDWINCNKCAIRYNNKIKFSLTECGHIFCEKCVHYIENSKKCIFCNKNTGTLLLSKQMDPSILEYFTPIDCLIKKVTEINEFQVKHRNILISNILSKYEYSKKQYMKQIEMINQLIKENKMLKCALRSQNQNSANSMSFLTSTPKSNGDRTEHLFLNQTPASSIKKFVNPNYSLMNNSLQSSKNSQYLNAFGNKYKPSPSQMVPQRRSNNENVKATMFSLEELRKKKNN